MQFITEPDQACTLAKQAIRHFPIEVCVGFFLDVQQRLICQRMLAQGTLQEVVVFPREVARVALQCHAASVVLAHNHPRANAWPSEADHSMTKVLQEALFGVGILLLDHIIVGEDQVLSFEKQGLMPKNSIDELPKVVCWSA